MPTRSRHAALDRRRLRLVLASLAGLGLLAAGTAYAQGSLAGDRPGGVAQWPALAEAARIPNDQGPSPACTGTPAPTGKPAPTPTAEPTADPTGNPTADPTEAPTADPTSTATGGVASLHRHPRGTPPSCHDDQGGPAASDFIDIRQVPPTAAPPRRGPDASTGLFVSACGRNENGHHNSDNFIVAPGVTNGAHHTHDYVGNLSTDGLSTNDSLAAAGTTCRRDDRSAYYWPVLRLRGTQGADQNADGGGNDGNVGRILEPASVRLEFRGNPTSRVVGMPRFLRIITGDAKATTNGPANARAQWTCTGFGNRLTTKYPLCPRGSQVQRVLVFPSCWDGINTDSANHRSHIVFPDKGTGACPAGTRAVPELRIRLTYSVPSGRSFALDSFPEQLHNPLTDHADFANVMSEALMGAAVDCINRGRFC